MPFKIQPLCNHPLQFKSHKISSEDEFISLHYCIITAGMLYMHISKKSVETFIYNLLSKLAWFWLIVKIHLTRNSSTIVPRSLKMTLNSSALTCRLLLQGHTTNRSALTSCCSTHNWLPISGQQKSSRILSKMHQNNCHLKVKICIFHTYSSTTFVKPQKENLDILYNTAVIQYSRQLHWVQ